MYRFEDFELDPQLFQLRKAGRVVHLEPQVFELLCHLVAHSDRVVPKTELIDTVWGHRHVSGSALTARLRAARRALGDDGRQQRFISTVHGIGYRFAAPVEEADRRVRVAPIRPGPQEIRSCRSPDGVRIAYAISGEGDPLVKAANWLTHLDLEWSSPVWAHWIAALSSRHRLVRYDERGCGLSDWDVGEFGFEDWVEDLETVVDSARLERFPLLGVSQGGAVAIAYAARHPERVTRLVLAGAYNRGRLVRAATPHEREEAALDLRVAHVAWRKDDASFRQVFASQFLPDGTRELWRAFDDLQRATTSTDNVVRFLDVFARIDVSKLAPRVRCPTLILHARGDLRVPVAQARELAGLIPDSRLVLLDGRNHILLADDPAWPVFLAELDSFVSGV